MPAVKYPCAHLGCWFYVVPTPEEGVYKHLVINLTYQPFDHDAVPILDAGSWCESERETRFVKSLEDPLELYVTIDIDGKNYVVCNHPGCAKPLANVRQRYAGPTWTHCEPTGEGRGLKIVHADHTAVPVLKEEAMAEAFAPEERNSEHAKTFAAALGDSDAGLATKGEIRMTDPSTGAQKGSKEARFDLIPVGPLTELAELYGFGAKKYADRNWERGYDFSLSYAAMQRHANLFWGGEDNDPETKKSHLASVAWHAFTMMQLLVTHPEKDDRPSRELGDYDGVQEEPGKVSYDNAQTVELGDNTHAFLSENMDAFKREVSDPDLMIVGTTRPFSKDLGSSLYPLMFPAAAPAWSQGEFEELWRKSNPDYVPPKDAEASEGEVPLLQDAWSELYASTTEAIKKGEMDGDGARTVIDQLMPIIDRTITKRLAEIEAETNPPRSENDKQQDAILGDPNEIGL